MQKSPIHLLGASRILPLDETNGDAVAAFYSELIPRLLTEVDRGIHPSRLVGFRANLNDATCWQFLGIESVPSDQIPAGMTALTLGDTAGEVLNRDGAQQRFDLTWQWRDDAAPCAVGEFDAVFPLEHPVLRIFSMTANAYVPAPGTPPVADAIELTAYDPTWPGQFDAMARWLRETFPDIATRIVHYGSTAVPGLPAKPVIDILIETPSFNAARRVLIPALNQVAWEYWWYADHMIFIQRDRATGARTHHIHIAPPGHRLWEGVAFRDYLIAHPEAAREYAALKHKLAAQFRGDRECYTNAKTAFIRIVTNQALSKHSE